MRAATTFLPSRTFEVAQVQGAPFRMPPREVLQLSAGGESQVQESSVEVEVLPEKRIGLLGICAGCLGFVVERRAIGV